MALIQREFIYIWYYFEIQLRQIFWYWIIGMAIGSLISVFAKDKIHGAFAELQGKELGLLGIIPACILGILSCRDCLFTVEETLILCGLQAIF